MLCYVFFQFDHHCYDEYQGQKFKDLMRKDLFQLTGYSLSLRKIRTITQGRNLTGVLAILRIIAFDQGTHWLPKKYCRNYGGMLLDGSFASSLLTDWLIQPKTICSENDATHSGLGPPASVNNEGDPPQTSWNIPQLRYPEPSKSSSQLKLTRACFFWKERLSELH